MLTRAPRSRAQLAEALRRRRVPDEVAESVLGRFAAVGLIDDAAFAAAWVDSRHQERGLARDALAHELGRRGVPDDLTRQAVDRIGVDAERATARDLVARRLAATRALPPVARVRTLCGVLVRRGYSVDMAVQVVLDALQGEGVEVGELEELSLGQP